VLALAEQVQHLAASATPVAVGLYTISPLPILCGVWHIQGRAGGRSCIAQTACNSTAVVWQYAGEIKG